MAADIGKNYDERKMMSELKMIGQDTDGYQVITEAIKDLINGSQIVKDRKEKIVFGECAETKGFSFFASTGAAIYSEQKDITGHVTQICQYPFDILYRAINTKESVKMDIQQFVDSLGKWLEKQPCTYGSKQYEVMKEYPSLTDGRIIKSIKRDTPCFYSGVTEKKVEDWVISLTVKYTNEFESED